MNLRRVAFDEHFAWWKKVNVSGLSTMGPEELAKSAAASAWNAALSWAAKQIGEKGKDA